MLHQFNHFLDIKLCSRMVHNLYMSSLFELYKNIKKEINQFISIIYLRRQSFQLFLIRLDLVSKLRCM